MQKNNFKLTKEWIIKSQNDLKSAQILFKENGPTSSLCFHCHQSIEKILKSFLLFNKNEFPKMHDIIYLLNLCEKIDKSLKSFKKEVSFLNRYYPPEITIYLKKECHKAIKYTEKITQFIINKIK